MDLGAKKINAFYDKLDVAVPANPKDVYFTYTELQDAGLTAADAVLTDDSGNEYRLPTKGELNLLLPMWTEEADRATVNKEKDGMYHPYWNDNPSTNTFSYVTVETPFTETIYLKNGEDNLPDQTHPDDTDSEYTLKGQSQMKVGAPSETVHYYTAEPDDPQKGNYNIRPVYGLRFKGTSQYAAYRWESCQIAGNPQERYLSIKIKALKQMIRRLRSTRWRRRRSGRMALSSSSSLLRGTIRRRMQVIPPLKISRTAESMVIAGPRRCGQEARTPVF